MMSSTSFLSSSSSSSLTFSSAIDGKWNGRKNRGANFARHPLQRSLNRRSVNGALSSSSSSSSSSFAIEKTSVSPNEEGKRLRGGETREIQSSMVAREFEKELTVRNNTNTKNKITLVSGYSRSIENLTREINDTNRGDEIQLSVYVFEHGKSTEKVIESLSNACNRGVSVRVKVDGSAVSKFTRFCEQSTTLVEKLRELEKERNNANEFELLESTIPTHAKFATFKRKNNGEYTGMLGCLLYTSPSPRDKRQSRMPSSA